MQIDTKGIKNLLMTMMLKKKKRENNLYEENKDLKKHFLIPFYVGIN
jgi:hypothetical protein